MIYDAFGSEWRISGDPLKRRPLSSVVLNDGIAEKLVNDMKEFIQNAKWYNDRGKMMKLCELVSIFLLEYYDFSS